MKKKEIEELKTYTVEELKKKVGELREEITKLGLDFKVNPPKDTNTLVKKRKRLAVILTIISEKIANIRET
jgi:ribosomal protein L29